MNLKINLNINKFKYYNIKIYMQLYIFWRLIKYLRDHLYLNSITSSSLYVY